MKINKNKQQEAQVKAREQLAIEEQERAETRLLKFVDALEQGKSEVLMNNEFMENLPRLISTYCLDGNRDRVHLLIDKLGDCAGNEDKAQRERAVMALSLCLTNLDREQHPSIIKQIFEVLRRWFRAETDFLSVCGPVCKQLQEEGVRLMEEGLWLESQVFLDVLQKIQSRQLEKNNAIRSVAGRAQEAIAEDHLLEELTLVVLHGRGERREVAEKTLLLLGRKATMHLLETLIASQKRADRLRLVGLIPATGLGAAVVLKEYLQKSLPWYAIRNIILMIEALDDPELIALTIPFLEHEDVRVQQQVLDCIYEVGGERKGEYLLNALLKVGDDLKPALVEYLGRTSEPGRMDLFLDLLAQRAEISSHIRDKLLQTLAVQVRLSETVRAVNLLNMLVGERKGDPKKDPVATAAIQSLHILKFRFKEEEIMEESEELPVDDELGEDVSFDGDPATLAKAKRKVQKINEQVAALLGEEKVSEASQLLYEQCIEAAMLKDFDVAELLIDRILEVDPSAVAKLIRAGERIEEERSSAISSSHVTIWQDLYDSLTTEEFNGLYYGMQQKLYSTGDVIAEQGTNSPVLYFINSGQAKLTYLNEKEEIFLKRINPGEIVGGGLFFDVSVWTVSLTSLGKVDLHILERETYLELLKDFPGIERCLIDYCEKNESVPELLQMSGADRRRAVRYPVSFIVENTLVNEKGEESGRSFKGEVADISTGGFSFIIRISRKENARLLLGRIIQVNFVVDEQESVSCRGHIVAVRYKPGFEQDYSVHIQFEETLADHVVRRIASN